MRIYTLSPKGVPENQHLFPTMRPTIISQGHSFVQKIEDCDIVFLDLHSRISGYNQSDVDWLIKNNIPVCTWDEWDRGNMSIDEWPNPLTDQQVQVFNHIYNDKIKSVHFCRLLNKTKTYPSNLHPYEKPVLYEEPLLSKEDLFNREFDVCFIANYSPSRERIAQALLEDKRLKCNISLGAQKIPFASFVNEHKKAKLFVSSGAGGYSNERPQYLFSISAMLQEKTDQFLANPFTHLENCLKINNPPTKNDIDTIFEIVNDKERLYEIYRSNYYFMKTYYSEQYMAGYVLGILKQNNIA